MSATLTISSVLISSSATHLSTSFAVSPTSTTSSAAPTSTLDNSINGIFESNANAQIAGKSNNNIGSFFAALATSVVVFAVQALIFIVIKGKLPRI